MTRQSTLAHAADVEHASAKELIAQIEAGSPEDDHYDAKLKVLGEYIDYHVQGEEGEMFPKPSLGRRHGGGYTVALKVPYANVFRRIGLRV